MLQCVSKYYSREIIAYLSKKAIPIDKKSITFKKAIENKKGICNKYRMII